MSIGSTWMRAFRHKLVVVALLLGAVAMLFPLLWMLLLSLKLYPQRFGSLWELIQAPVTVQNYLDIWISDNFARYFANSFLVAGTTAVGNVLLCTLSAYALARKTFVGKRWVFASVLLVMMVPPHVLMIPLYRLMVAFHWLNTYWALIVPWLITPFGIFLMKQYIDQLPMELEDAARLDGASEWQILWKIVFPLSKPMLVVLGLYVFLSQWNAFLFPFLFASDLAHRTLPVGLAFYFGKQSIDWGHLMAGAALSALPVLLLLLFFQRHIVQAMIAGALKE